MLLHAVFGTHVLIGRPQNGLFTTYIPWLLSVETGKIQLMGDGDQAFSTTHTEDIAGFLAYILTHLPASELNDKVFRIEGARVTLREAIGFYRGKYPIEHVDAITGDAVKTLLQEVIGSGEGVAVEDGVATSNALWVGHAWKGVKEVLGLQ